MKSILMIMLLISSSLTLAEQYYQADPAKLAALEAQRCAKLQKENNLINQRLSGNNKPYDIAKMKDRQKVVQADYAKYCSK